MEVKPRFRYSKNRSLYPEQRCPLNRGNRYKDYADVSPGPNFVTPEWRCPKGEVQLFRILQVNIWVSSWVSAIELQIKLQQLMSLDRRISLTWVSSFNYSHKYLLRFIILINPTFLKEGDMGVYGSAVLSFFSSGISVILILMCGIVVSSSPAVCGFSFFWLTVFGKRRSITVLRYCSSGLSF